MKEGVETCLKQLELTSFGTVTLNLIFQHDSYFTIADSHIEKALCCM